MSQKERIDKLLFERGLAPSRERAQAYIMAGKVLVNEEKVEKPGHKIPINSCIRILGEDQPFVSRGGLKLAGALQTFNLDVKNLIAMDVGASTGGFTDCLIQNGVSFVFAIDSGTNQLDWRLAKHPKVKSLEKCNFRHLEMASIGTFVDLIVIDVSFISLEKILGNCKTFLVRGGKIIALIKPQFEAGKELVQKGGVVNDERLHQSIIQKISTFADSIGLKTIQFDDSPISGKKSGNKEFLIHLQKSI